MSTPSNFKLNQKEYLVGYEKEVSFKSLVMSEQFCKLFIMGFLHCSYALYFIETYKEIAEEYISDMDLTLIGSYGGVCLTVMRILGGILLDKYSFKSIYIVVAVLIIIQISTVNYFVTNVYLYSLNCITLMTIEGLLVVIMPTITLNTFGMVRGPTVYSAMNAYAGAGSLLMILMIQTVKASYGFDGMFITYFIFQIVAIASTCSLIFKDFKFDYDKAFEEEN